MISTSRALLAIFLTLILLSSSSLYCNAKGGPKEPKKRKDKKKKNNKKKPSKSANYFDSTAFPTTDGPPPDPETFFAGRKRVTCNYPVKCEPKRVGTKIYDGMRICKRVPTPIKERVLGGDSHKYVDKCLRRRPLLNERTTRGSFCGCCGGVCPQECTCPCTLSPVGPIGLVDGVQMEKTGTNVFGTERDKKFCVRKPFSVDAQLKGDAKCDTSCLEN